MLIDCPECARAVSDRAPACPQCGFPIAAHVAEAARAASARTEHASRRAVGRTDCPACDARGFVLFETKTETGETRSAFTWCSACAHSGGVSLCHSTRGYWAVLDDALNGFLAGAIDDGHEAVTHLGPQAPARRYPPPPDEGEPPPQ